MPKTRRRSLLIIAFILSISAACGPRAGDGLSGEPGNIGTPSPDMVIVAQSLNPGEVIEGVDGFAIGLIDASLPHPRTVTLGPGEHLTNVNFAFQPID